MYYLDLRDKIYGRFHAVFLIAMAVVVAIILLLILRSVLNLRKSNRAKNVARAVKIVSKRTEVDEDGGIYSTNYYVTYLLADGEEVEFRVTRDTYEESKRGNTGYLLYQGDRFLAFKTTY
ncbi:MAG: DUF2500 domain-containing protein [Clostridia bacterium]|nr:DUF2500 domain-containing protein [Clostridia bacterium]